LWKYKPGKVNMADPSSRIEWDQFISTLKEQEAVNKPQAAISC
jgi:hypothetical protein